jgi:lipoprotein-anchoring transpeptidase ErfK/SrfK/murein DD-endopeptidase MepM/ murein hydrolase activator NlpD
MSDRPPRQTLTAEAGGFPLPTEVGASLNTYWRSGAQAPYIKKMRKNLALSLLLILAGVLLAARNPPGKESLAHRAMQSLTVQVLLDRQNYSPGEIDASLGTNTRRALNKFEKDHNLQPTQTGQPSDQTLKALGAVQAQVLTEYTITPEDVRGPYVKSIPKEFLDQAKLEALSYTSPLEQLGEKFHSSPDLMRMLNKSASWKEGEKIEVPNIDLNPPEPPAKKKTLKVIVTEATSSVEVEDPNGHSVFYAPVTAGSEHDPLPLGNWKVVGVGRHPKFHYNPDLFWDAKATDTKATLAPGPNNPVGVVWIDLDAPHYGLHGTPEPSKIGYTESHGCVRLTNWDASRLANLVVPGTIVTFQHDENEQQMQTAPAAPQTQPQTQQTQSVPKPQPQPLTFAEKELSILKSLFGTSGSRDTGNRGEVFTRASLTVQGDIGALKKKKLLLPVKGIALEQLTDSFYDNRSGNRRHEAIDILAPRNTPVLAVEDGRIAKLWLSVPGGITIYQFDPTMTYAYYYAHLERYVPDLKEGEYVHRGQVIGFVGTSGNAPANTPHLHFTIFKLTPDHHWWQGQAINPYTVFRS